MHLGTYGSHAKELNNYLSSIKPKTLVLNGDIFDFDSVMSMPEMPTYRISFLERFSTISLGP